MMPYGRGSIDWPTVVHELEQLPYEGLFNLEIPGERHCVLALRQRKARYARDVSRWLIGLTGTAGHDPLP